MPTRIYCTSGTPAVTPADWEFAEQAATTSVVGTTTKNTGFAMTTVAGGTSNAGTPVLRALARTIVGPLTAQTISGTLKGQMRCVESNAGANATLAVAVKLVTAAGADRAVLLAPVASDNTSTTPPEMAVTAAGLTNRPCQDTAESASLTLTSQAAQTGDYLVIEWGFRCNTGTNRTITISYGNDSATDLGENSTDTNAYNPWWEFSGTLTLLDVLHEPSVANTCELTETVTVRLGVALAVAQTVALSGGTVTGATQPPGVNGAVAVSGVTQAVIPASLHAISSPHILVSAYDGQTPRQRFDPGSVTVHPTTYAVTASALQPMTGVLILTGAPQTQAPYAADFSLTEGPYTLTVSGATHGFTTPNLHVAVYDASTPRQAITPGAVSIHPTTYAVVVTFLQPTSGRVVIGAYANHNGTALQGIAFTADADPYTVTITEATHGLPTADLLLQVYDASTPRQRLQPGSTTIHPTTHTITLTFLQPTSGTVVLAGAAPSGGISVANTAQLTEAVTLLGLTIPVAVASTLQGTEVVQCLLTPLVTSSAETLQLTDTRTVAGLIPALQGTGTVQLTETAALTVTPLALSVTDALDLTDTVTVQRGVEGVVDAVASNTLTVSEASTVVVTPLALSVMDAGTLTETTLVQSSALLVSVQETLALTATVTLVATPLVFSASETVQLTESVMSTSAPLVPGVQDLLSLTDLPTVTVLAPVARGGQGLGLLAFLGLPRLGGASALFAIEDRNTVLLSATVTLTLTPLHATPTTTATLSETVTVTGLLPSGALVPAVENLLSLTDTATVMTVAPVSRGGQGLGLLAFLGLPRLGGEPAFFAIEDRNTVLVSATVSLTLTPLHAIPTATATLSETVTVTGLLLQQAVTDTTQLTESVSVRMTALRASVQETLTLDAAVSVVPTLVVQPLDVLALSETVALHQTPFVLTVTDTLGLTDTPTVLRMSEGLWQASVSSLVALTDVPMVVQTPLPVAVADTLALTEYAALLLPVLPMAVTDALTLTDVPVLVLTPLVLSTADTVALTEAMQVVRAMEGLWQLSVSDTTALTETPTVLVPVLPIGVSESLLLTETLATAGSLMGAGADQVSLTDGVSVSLAQLPVVLIDAVTLTDVPVLVLPVLHVSTMSALALPDTVQVLRAVEGLWQVGVSSAVALTDTATLYAPFLVVTAAETLALTDLVTLTGTMARSISTSLTLTDVPVLRLPLLHVSITSPLAATDTLQVCLTPLRPTVTETVALMDPVTLLRGIEGVWQAQVSQTVALTETVALSLLTRVSCTSTLALIEAPILTSTTTSAVSVTVTLAEVLHVSLSHACTAADTLAVIDSPAILLPWLVPTVMDSLEVVPTVSVVIPLVFVSESDAVMTLDSVEVYKVPEGTYLVVVDEPALSLTETLLLTSTSALSLTDAVTLSETVQVTLGLTALVTETVAATDAVTVDLRLTVSVTQTLQLTTLLTVHAQVQPQRIRGVQDGLRRSHGTTDTVRQSGVVEETLV